ncbi:MAG: DUF4190 domain-containing protein [Verrucomicrobiota bacterium]
MDEAQPAEKEQRPWKLFLAAASLGFGLASLPLIGFFICGMVAIATGHLARRRTDNSYASTTAGVMSIVGITLGYSTLILGSAYTISNGSGRGGHSRSTTSMATAVALVSAVDNFYTEYGALPNVGSRVTTDSPEGRKLLSILLGLDEKSDKSLNSRGIKFLSVKEAKANRSGGLVYSGSGNSVEGLYDSWGNPFTVELDADYNEELHFTVASRAVDLNGRRAVAYSPGADKKLGTADDVINW